MNKYFVISLSLVLAAAISGGASVGITYLIYNRITSSSPGSPTIDNGVIKTFTFDSYSKLNNKLDNLKNESLNLIRSNSFLFVTNIDQLQVESYQYTLKLVDTCSYYHRDVHFNHDNEVDKHYYYADYFDLSLDFNLVVDSFDLRCQNSFLFTNKTKYPTYATDTYITNITKNYPSIDCQLISYKTNYVLLNTCFIANCSLEEFNQISDETYNKITSYFDSLISACLIKTF